MNLAAEAAWLRAGAASVTFTTSGSSMEPPVRSGAAVTVAPLATAPRKGDVVLAKDEGRWYPHLGHRRAPNDKRHVDGSTAAENVNGRLER